MAQHTQRRTVLFLYNARLAAASGYRTAHIANGYDVKYTRKINLSTPNPMTQIDLGSEVVTAHVREGAVIATCHGGPLRTHKTFPNPL